MKKQKKILLITVIVTAVAIGIVYAAFTALTLRVNTSATASASIFSVGFDDVAPTIEKSNDNIIATTTTPSEGASEITLSFSGLKNPGDTASACYTILNDGDVDATNITIKTGPDRQLEVGQSPQVWTSDDGVFEFGVYANAGGDYVDGYWSLSSPLTLRAGEKGRIRIDVKLLKMVDEDTTASCTATITAEPGNLGIAE